MRLMPPSSTPRSSSLWQSSLSGLLKSAPPHLCVPRPTSLTTMSLPPRRFRRMPLTVPTTSFVAGPAARPIDGSWNGRLTMRVPADAWRSTARRFVRSASVAAARSANLSRRIANCCACCAVIAVRVVAACTTTLTADSTPRANRALTAPPLLVGFRCSTASTWPRRASWRCRRASARARVPFGGCAGVSRPCSHACGGDYDGPRAAAVRRIRHRPAAIDGAGRVPWTPSRGDRGCARRRDSIVGASRRRPQPAAEAPAAARASQSCRGSIESPDTSDAARAAVADDHGCLGRRRG